MSDQASDLQTQVSALQSQVNTLEGKVSAIEAQLGKLQTPNVSGEADDDDDIPFPVGGAGP